MNTDEKLKKLREMLTQMGRVLIAFSGGTDSTFLLKIASELSPGNVLAVTATSPTYPEYEFEEAVKIARELKVRHITIESKELENPQFVENTPDRCFYCKKELFADLIDIAQHEGIEYVLDASNADDLKDYRPGRKAAKELGIRSPLVDAGITKDEIRALSKKMGLSTWNKPPFACLASRFPYGTKITDENLKIVYQGEKFLRQHGFVQFRVRHHAPVVRLELDIEGFNKLQDQQLRAEIVKFFKNLGYLFITADLEGYRSGSLNEMLPDKKEFRSQ
jgi:pyridinium-3,5-biscarboxylic acid mononucleotide sulfurtransferase